MLRLRMVCQSPFNFKVSVTNRTFEWFLLEMGHFLFSQVGAPGESHLSHGNGLDPECIALCLLNSFFLLNLLSHWSPIPWYQNQSVYFCVVPILRFWEGHRATLIAFEGVFKVSQLVLVQVGSSSKLLVAFIAFFEGFCHIFYYVKNIVLLFST